MTSYTIHHNPCINQDIQKDLNHIIDCINSCGIKYLSIYLIGAFGRGEGSVHYIHNRWHGINDYDLTIITEESNQIESFPPPLCEKLAQELDIDFVDIGIIKYNSLRNLRPTLQNYDLIYGSTCISGKNLKHDMPEFKAESIPPFEFLRLLCNRTAGLLSTKLPERCNSQTYCYNQYIKACIAVGDIVVYLNGGYQCSYHERQKTFIKLARNSILPFNLSESEIEIINNAYTIKLNGGTNNHFPADDHFIKPLIYKAFCSITTYCCFENTDEVLKAESALKRKYHLRNKDILITLFNRIVLRNPAPLLSVIRKTILFSLPFFYTNSSVILEKFRYLHKFWLIPHALTSPWNTQSVFKLWEQYNH